jgi:hypothetical protein
VTTTETTECPVSATTNSFGILTPDGRFIRFDNPSNTRVLEIVRGNQTFAQAPARVTVVGTANGDIAVVESLTPIGISAERVGPTGGTTAAVAFDARYKGDRGKLVVGENSLTFEDVSNAKRSQT